MSDTVRVLHVEDDPEFADLTARFLERVRPSFEVTSVTDGGTALETLAAERIDCVVSDYEMPGMDGLELLDAVRADHPDLPFVLFTGKGDEQLASDAISAGVTDYLRKGTGTGRDQYVMLANRVENGVESYRAKREVRRRARAIEAVDEGVAIFDREGRYEAVNEAYAELYGYDREALLGEPWRLVKPDDEVERFETEILPGVRDGKPWEGRTVGLRADGTRIRVRTFATTMADGSGVAVARELRSEGVAEATFDGLREAATDLARSETVDAAAERAVDAAATVLDVDHCAVALVDGGSLEPVAVAGEFPVDALRGDVSGDGLAGRTVAEGEPLVANDVGGASPDADFGPFASALSVPVADEGVLQAVSGARGAFGETADGEVRDFRFRSVPVPTDDDDRPAGSVSTSTSPSDASRSANSRPSASATGSSPRRRRRRSSSTTPTGRCCSPTTRSRRFSALRSRPNSWARTRRRTSTRTTGSRRGPGRRAWLRTARWPTRGRSRSSTPTATPEPVSS